MSIEKLFDMWRNDEILKYYVICAAVSALSWLSQFCTSKNRFRDNSKFRHFVTYQITFLLTCQPHKSPNATKPCKFSLKSMQNLIRMYLRVIWQRISLPWSLLMICIGGLVQHCHSLSYSKTCFVFHLRNNMLHLCFEFSGLSSQSLRVNIPIFLPFVLRTVAVMPLQYWNSQGYYSRIYYNLRRTLWRTSINLTLKTLNRPQAVELSARLTKRRISSKPWRHSNTGLCSSGYLDRTVRKKFEREVNWVRSLPPSPFAQI